MWMADTGVLVNLGIVMILLGISIIALVLLFASFKKTETGKVSSGGAIIIGPIPIVFGTDKKALRTVLSLSIVLTFLLLVVMVMNYLLR